MGATTNSGIEWKEKRKEGQSTEVNWELGIGLEQELGSLW